MTDKEPFPIIGDENAIVGRLHHTLDGMFKPGSERIKLTRGELSTLQPLTDSVLAVAEDGKDQSTRIRALKSLLWAFVRCDVLVTDARVERVEAIAESSDDDAVKSEAFGVLEELNRPVTRRRSTKQRLQYDE